MNSNQNNNLDKLLSDLKAEYKESNSLEVSQNNQEIDSLLDDLKAERKTSKASAQAKDNRVNHATPEVIESLDSIKAKFQSQQKQQQERKDLSFAQNKQEIIIQEQQKQLRQKQLVRQAEKWLENLDLNSDEGMWFTQLADSYPSRLEAAISYLSTMNEANS